MSAQVKIDQLIPAWSALADLVDPGPIRDEDHYDRMIALLNTVLEATRGQDEHPLDGLIDILVHWIEQYEQIHYPPKDVPPREVLRFLMDSHGLTQSDLPELGSQGVVSEILAGKRRLNTRQIARLTARFGVSADVFIEPAA
jgi:HTH-type transcriptional regulator/antitoxin HigA